MRLEALGVVMSVPWDVVLAIGLVVVALAIFREHRGHGVGGRKGRGKP